jgi:hypothetical protein
LVLRKGCRPFSARILNNGSVHRPQVDWHQPTAQQQNYPGDGTAHTPKKAAPFGPHSGNLQHLREIARPGFRLKSD